MLGLKTTHYTFLLLYLEDGVEYEKRGSGRKTTHYTFFYSLAAAPVKIQRKDVKGLKKGVGPQNKKGMVFWYSFISPETIVHYFYSA